MTDPADAGVDADPEDHESDTVRDPETDTVRDPDIDVNPDIDISPDADRHEYHPDREHAFPDERLNEMLDRIESDPEITAYLEAQNVNPSTGRGTTTTARNTSRSSGTARSGCTTC